MDDQRTQVEFGDWQTPQLLADEVVSTLVRSGGEMPAVVVEPTCGSGSFLKAAATRFPHASLKGYDLNPAYVASTREGLPRHRSEVRVADVFKTSWADEIRPLPEPVWVVGNPPWVTNAALGSLSSENLPAKSNFKALSGLDAITGKSNFDVSEWVILRMLDAIQGRNATIGMLCKFGVARKVVEYVVERALRIVPGGIWHIDARRHFGVSVDAVLFAARGGAVAGVDTVWPVFSTLRCEVASSSVGWASGELFNDAAAWRSTESLRGRCVPTWRSGVKHDCSSVMELRMESGKWFNGLGEPVDIEDECSFPLLKSADVANARLEPRRRLVTPQHKVGEPTHLLKVRAPKTYGYLQQHEAALAARKSAIYKSQPKFALFGIGPYSFAAWKIAVSGLYKRLQFALVGPYEDRPVLFDDTCYFLPFDDPEVARTVLEALNSDTARRFFDARVFWDAKRPISKSLLESLHLHALLADLNLPPVLGACQSSVSDTLSSEGPQLGFALST